MCDRLRRQVRQKGVRGSRLPCGLEPTGGAGGEPLIHGLHGALKSRRDLRGVEALPGAEHQELPILGAQRSEGLEQWRARRFLIATTVSLAAELRDECFPASETV